MTTYFCGPGGNDGNSGLTWALRKLTLNGVEDIPVVAGDVAYIGPGVYRETLTVDVSGGAGTEIVYIADVTGENTDGVGGIIRITGSDNDQTAARANCIAADDKDYRTFRGFSLDTTSDRIISNANGCTNWTIEDCVIQNGDNNSVVVSDGADQSNFTFRRCKFLFSRSVGVHFLHSSEVDNANHLIENCIFLAMRSDGVRIDRIGDVTIRNCLFVGCLDDAVDVATSPNAGHPCIVNNCIFVNNTTALEAVGVADMTENFNTFYSNGTDRTNVNIGANSLTYPPLLLPPILFSGASQISGIKFPHQFGALSEWSQVTAITGSNEPTEDYLGIVRPTTASKNSWGPLQFRDAERETGTVRTGTSSIVLHDAASHQMYVPIANESTTISVYVYREANYAGTNPRMVIKQPGQADDTTTDTGAAGVWNLLTTTLTPAALPPYVIVELQSLNTAAAGNYDTFFDDLTVE